MALCRLLQSRQNLHFRNKAFLGSRRWFCACPATDTVPEAPPPRRGSEAKKKKIESVRSFLERYMLSHPGVFPKLKLVQNEVGGSWHTLKEIVSELRIDMLPGLENKQPGTLDSCATAKSTSEVRVIGESADPCKLDTPEKEIVAELRTEMFPGSVNKQLGIADACATTNSTSEVRAIDESVDPCKLVTPEKRPNLLTEKLDKIELCTATVSTTVKSSETSGPMEVINIEQSKNNLTRSTTVLAQHLLNTDHQTVKEGAITSNADMFVSEAQLIGVTDNVKENYCTDTNYLAPNHNAQESRIHSQAPNQISSAVESNKPRNVRGLVDFLKTDTEKWLETSRTKVNNPEQEKHSYLEERNHNNLLDIFTSKPPVSRDSNPVYEKNTRQSISSHPREECSEDIVRRNGGATDSMGTQVNDILQKIMRDSKEKQTNGSSDNAPSKPSKPILNLNHLGLANSVTFRKTNILNEETRGSEPESLNFPNISERLHSSTHLNKAKVWKPAVETDIAASKEANILNFAAKVDREEQKGSTVHGIESRKLPCGKDSMAIDSSQVPFTEIMSDESDSDVAAFDYTKPESNDEVLVSVQGSNLNANSVMVKFLLKTVKTSAIGLAFGDCGPIAEIFIVPSRKDNRYNYSYVRFKTEDGLRKALGKTDVTICGADVVVEPVASSMMHNKLIPIESPSDPDFPINILKNPGRTVTIQGLPESTSFHFVSSELSNWGRVTGVALGSSSSSVYVEFESEEIAERVLSEATISVSGSKLGIFSANHPRTTVLRISNVNPITVPVKIRSVCDSFGQVKRLVIRGTDVFDVHFALSEWSNMLKILNKMNGLVCDEAQWVVKPATVFPAEVLQAIWNEPDGRKHIHKLIQDLCRRVEEKAIDTAPLRDLARKYYGDV